MNLKYKFKKLSNLVDYDLINKYLVTSIFNIPNIKNITIDVFLYKVIEDNNLNEGNILGLEIKIFLLLYFYFLKIPFFIVKKIIKKNKKQQEIFLKSFFRILYIQSNDIYYFLLELFIEKKKLSNLVEKNSLSKLLVNKTFQKFLSFQFFVLSKTLIDFEKFSKILLQDNLLKNINLAITIMVKKSSNINNYLNFLKNLPFFWLNN